MNIMNYILLVPTCICAPIPMKPFLYDNDINPTNFIIENNIQESKRVLLYEEENTVMNDIKDKQFWIDLHEEENTVMNDIKDKQFWIDFKQSLYSYDKLLEEAKETGEYYDIDFDEMNRGIMEELCEEMDGIEEFCVRNTKTFELTILEKDPLDMGKIIKNFNSNDTPFNLIDY